MLRGVARSFEKVEMVKQEARQKVELEKRFRTREEGGAAEEGALERLTDGHSSSDDSDDDDEMKLKEEQIAGAMMSLMLSTRAQGWQWGGYSLSWRCVKPPSGHQEPRRSAVPCVDFMKRIWASQEPGASAKAWRHIALVGRSIRA